MRFVTNNPQWTISQFNFDADVVLAEEKAGMMNALDTNLKPFFDRGGKIILVPRLERSADLAAQRHPVLRPRRQGDGRRESCVQQLPAVHGAWHGALRRRHRDVDVRHADRARAVG
jgi:hypothetical protein